MKPRPLIAALIVIGAGLLAPFATLAEVGEFAGSGGRTIKFRYELKPDWSPDVPRGVHIRFHGNNRGTQDDMISWFHNRDLAWKFDLIPVTVASPEAIPAGGQRWQYDSTDQPYTGYGTRVWRLDDQELVHNMLQSEFGQRFRVDFDRIVFEGGSSGTCFLNRFVPRYGENYGGGLLADCGCFSRSSGHSTKVSLVSGPDLRPSIAMWKPPPDFRQKFRVFVRSTKEDFLYWDSLAAYGYYKYTVGLETAGDLEASGGHCSLGDVAEEAAVEWLLNGTVLPEEGTSPHFTRVSIMDGLVGITVDREGALWVARQHVHNDYATILRSVDRGERFEAVGRVQLDVHDIDATGSSLVITVNENGVQSRYRSSNMAKDFEKVDLEGSRILDGMFLSNTIADIHGNVYAMVPNSSGRQEAHVSDDGGQSWTPLGDPFADSNRVTWPHPGGAFVNPDPIQTAQSAFLILAEDTLEVRSVGSTMGNDWSSVSPLREGAGWGAYSLAWDGINFFGLPQHMYYDFGVVFASTDKGMTWSEERLSDKRAVSWTSRVSAIGNGESLVVGGTGNGYLRNAAGEWRRVLGAVYVGDDTESTIGAYWQAAKDRHRLAVDPSRGDVYLTDGLGIFRLDGRFRSDGAVGQLPDTDGDRVPDALDAFPSDSSEYLDTDGDGLANGIDDDDDGDGVRDTEDGVALNRFETVDTDGDGVGDSADPDDDGDGVSDAIDAFPLDRGARADSDADGMPDSVDDDDDGDGVRDSEDAFPKYPHEWLDTDRDGIGDNIDGDDDNDGLLDAQDPEPKRGEARLHLLPLTARLGNTSWGAHSGWSRKDAQLHTELPVVYTYPQSAGQSQEYGQITLGNGTTPDVQFMIDYLDGVGLLYVDRNNNGDLSDDGPPVRPRYDDCCLFQSLQIDVSYASGVTVPYIVSLATRQASWREDGLAEIVRGGAWIGNVELPNGSSVLALTVDRDIDGLFTGAEDYVCLDTDGDFRLDCPSLDSPERFVHDDVAIVAGDRLRVMVVESGHRIAFEPVDHGNTRSTATRIALPSTTSGTINPGKDTDYFRFVVPTRGVVVMESAGGLDTVGTLFDARGGRIVQDDDGAGYPNFRIERTLDADIYYVRVHSSGRATGGYELRLRGGGGESSP